MLSVNRQASDHVISYMILAVVFSKICIIDFFQLADNFFRYRTTVLHDK